MGLAMSGMETCPFCRGGLAPYWPAASIWRCQACDCRFRTPGLTGSELDLLYREAWNDPDANRSETGGTNLRLARIYAHRLLETLGLPNIENLRILDFGAGTGAMAMALAERGADVHCVDRFAYPTLRELGHKAWRSIDDLPADFKADGIVALDVIEHLPRPWEELGGLRNLLTDVGWIYVSTLNARSLNARVMRGTWREAVKEGHLVFFTPASLERVLAAAGYRTAQRLRWFVRYRERPLHRALHFTLQATGLESGLRYLAWKASRP